MPSVYLETSFFSSCVWDRPDAKSIAWQDESRRWWVQERRKHSLFLSYEVIRELSEPGFRHREEALALTAGIPELSLNDEVRGLAKLLVGEKVMPGPDGQGDAVHVSTAIAHRIEYLLTWNVKHLANPNKIRHLREVCLKVGFTVPQLVTPQFLWEEKGEEP